MVLRRANVAQKGPQAFPRGSPGPPGTIPGLPSRSQGKLEGRVWAAGKLMKMKFKMKIMKMHMITNMSAGMWISTGSGIGMRLIMLHALEYNSELI